MPPLIQKLGASSTPSWKRRVNKSHVGEVNDTWCQKDTILRPSTLSISVEKLCCSPKVSVRRLQHAFQHFMTSLVESTMDLSAQLCRNASTLCNSRWSSGRLASCPSFGRCERSENGKCLRTEHRSFMFTLIPGVTVIGVPPQAHETCKPFHPANVEGEWSHEHLRVGPEASLLHSLTSIRAA